MADTKDMNSRPTAGASFGMVGRCWRSRRSARRSAAHAVTRPANDRTASAASRISRRRRSVFAGTAVLLVLLLAVGIGEIVVRLAANPCTIDELIGQSLVYRPAVYCRSRLEPDRLVGLVGSGSEASIRINRRGLRGADFAPVKPPGTVRIVFLGGSSVFSANTPGPGNDWPHRAVAYLNRRGLDAECINAGVPGHATADSVGKLLTELAQYQPDYVVLYQAYNDQKYFDRLDLQTPYRDLIPPYDPSSDPRTNPSGLDRLLCRSRLYLELRHRYFQRVIQAEGPRRGLFDQTLELGDRINPAALAQYRLNVQTICDLARNVSAVPILCKQGRLVSPANGPEQRAKLSYQYVRLTHDAWCRAFAECDRVIDQVAAQKNAPVVDVSAAVTGNPALFLDHVHLTPAGDRVVGEYVGRALHRILRDHGPAAERDPDQLAQHFWTDLHPPIGLLVWLKSSGVA